MYTLVYFNPRLHHITRFIGVPNFPGIAIPHTPYIECSTHAAFILYRNDKILKLLIKAGTNSQYQIQSFEGSHVFLIIFYQCCSHLIGYRMPQKLDYCFVMSTSLVPVTVSTRI